MSQASYTRLVYEWERGLEFPILPMSELRAWAGRVWKKERFDKPMPRIVAGPGVRYSGERMSFSKGGLIVLSRHQRDKVTLLHEMCHYLGTDREADHGPAFQDRYATLLLRHVF